MNNQIAFKRYGADTLFRARFERPEGNGQVMVVDKLFALEIQLSHVAPVRPIRAFVDRIESDAGNVQLLRLF